MIPLSFSSPLGDKMTLFGTPANVLAMGILADRGLSALGFFEVTPRGIIVLATGILYMVLIGLHLLPVREGAQVRQDVYRLPHYSTEVWVLPRSPLAGETLLESGLDRDCDLTVLAIERDGVRLSPTRRDTRVQIGDLLTVEGSANDLMAARGALGLANEAGRKLDLDRFGPGTVQLIEATLAPCSGLVGRTLRGARFRDLYGFTALAIRRHREAIAEKLRYVPLEFGDALLAFS